MTLESLLDEETPDSGCLSIFSVLRITNCNGGIPVPLGWVATPRLRDVGLHCVQRTRESRPGEQERGNWQEESYERHREKTLGTW